jgi:hypothetical protein
VVVGSWGCTVNNWPTCDSSVAVLLGTGGGGLSAPRNVPAGNIVGGIAVGDFNDDGKPDLAIANLYSDDILIYLNVAP